MARWSMTAEERFWSKVDVLADTECWCWMGNADRKGYGRFLLGRDKVLAHRASWILHHHEDPGEMCVLHKCDTPPCVNPAHLFLGTKHDNNTDMRQKGRARGAPGERSGQAKLTEALVAQIRASYAAGGTSCVKLAKAFGISDSSAWNIVARKSWRHVG